jgi:hypothetical protein
MLVHCNADLQFCQHQISKKNTKFHFFLSEKNKKGENKANSPSEKENSRNLPFTMIPAIFLFL